MVANVHLQPQERVWRVGALGQWRLCGGVGDLDCATGQEGLGHPGSAEGMHNAHVPSAQQRCCAEPGPWNGAEVGRTLVTEAGLRDSRG